MKMTTNKPELVIQETGSNRKMPDLGFSQLSYWKLVFWDMTRVVAGEHVYPDRIAFIFKFKGKIDKKTPK
jgi:hypothetical protein